MKKHLLSFVLLVLNLSMFAQQPDRVSTGEWAKLWRYNEANVMLASEPAAGRVVFVGNSITDFWEIVRPEFFFENGFVCRGISAQTTPQMLLRFRHDVVETGASTVVILAGTNDIAGNNGYSSIPEISGFIADMCEIALANGVRPLLCSVLPAHQYSWNKNIHPETEIPLLNARLKEYAGKRGIEYVDFFSAMVDSDPANFNGLPEKYSKDGVHPTAEGYRIMEDVILNFLKDEVKKNNSAKNGRKVRLMSYNIRNCIGMDRETFGGYRIAEVIGDCAPDVVALQEIDSCTARSGGVSVMKRLAAQTGMHHLFAPAIEYGGGKYGIGMLSLREPLRYEYVPLPGSEEARVLLMVEFDDFIYCCTHLSLTKEDRIASVKIIDNSIKKFAGKIDKPVFIAGDWNDEPDSEFYAEISRYFDILTDISQNTFPADNPDCTIDYIARWKGNRNTDLAEPFNYKVHKAATASDHLPISIDLK